MPYLLRWISCLTLVMISWLPRATWAQTPSPLQEWQYSGGVILARLFQTDLPDWRVIAGGAADVAPIYDGASAMKVSGGPVFNVYYKDQWYVSTGEGVGYNFVRGKQYQIGLAMAYDQGRSVKDDETTLRGMGDIYAAPVAKLYASVVLSKKFPIILRLTARQSIGGDQGAVGDASVYLPLPGSSKTFVMFAGPSITMATAHYRQVVYGVDEQQSLDSGHPVFNFDHAGTTDAGVGFSATKFIGSHLLINVDGALSQVRGRPSRSPIVEDRTQRVLALSMEYHWESGTTP